MDALRDLTSIIEQLSQAQSFKDAADRLTRWARSYTSCQAAILRLVEEGEEGRWLAGCALDGPSSAFARDETVVSVDECICGRVATGLVDTALPFYTAGGSFYWGRLSTLEEDFTPAELGPLRGRCVRESYESLAVFPLRAGERVVGSLHLGDARPDHFQGSLDVVESACRVAGGILLRHKAEERERALLEAVQAALLPSAPPAVEGLSIGVSFGSATDLARVGGDFYDVLDLGGTGALILVGDACGKGVEAAGMAARARYAMEAHASQASDPAAFMATANEALLRLLPRERFVTAVACLIDPGSGSVTTCLAGHPSPLRLNPVPPAGRDGPEINAPHNPPLGLFAGFSFEGATGDLLRADTLLIYTDGVSDARRGNARFGSQGIMQVAATHFEEDPETIARSICTTAAEYHDPRLPADDRLVMAVRLVGGC